MSHYFGRPVGEPVIEHGIPAGLVSCAARLLFASFELKINDELRAVTNEQAIAIIERSIDPSRAWVAVDASGELVGLVGVGEPGHPFLHVRFSMLTREFGVLRSVMRWVRWALTHDFFRPAPGQWHIDIVAVDPQWRSRGIGSTLLRAVSEAARGSGVHSVRLAVVDTNPRARALYESLGFRTTFTLRTGLLTASAGYRAAHLMRLDLDAAET